MVNVVSVKHKREKKEETEEAKPLDYDRKTKGLDYIKSLKKEKTEENKKIETSEGASWATPKGVSEDFSQKPKSPTVESEPGSWASPKGVSSDEKFGPVRFEVPEIESKPKKFFKQVKTGIKGLDNILDGGIPEGNLVTISGGPGSGKTIMGLQFIYNGAKMYNEPGVFISLEERPERLIKTAKSFGWDFQEQINKKKIIMTKVSLFKFNVLKNTIRETVSRIKAKRLVIDPAALFELFFDRQIELRKALVELGAALKELGCTTLVTTDATRSKNFEQGDFSSDGIIYTYYTKISNQFMRMIGIIKMRGTNHSEKIHPLRITSHGLEVMSDEEVFQDITSSKF